MARSRKKVDTDTEDLDLTSMIDVCFLLIAFFIMVTEVSKSEVVEIFLPHASFAKEDTNPPDDRLVVNIDREGQVWIRGTNYGFPNKTDSKKDLERELKAIAEAVGYDENVAGKPSNLTVLVRADAHVANRYVQCLQILLTQAKVMKLHYSAKNPSQDS
jgi:biopolymer transport protein ExbD